MKSHLKAGIGFALLCSAATGAYAQAAGGESSAPASGASGDGADMSDIVLTAATLAHSGAANITDVANLVPSLTFDPQATPGALNLSIRGVSMAQGAEAPLAFVIDGVPVPDPIYMNQSLLNITQVEVLRGPQGSLYGRNALAGVIILESQQPTNDFHGGILGRYGNGNDRYVQADLSGAIVPDKLLFSVAGNYDRFDGLRSNTFLNKKWDSRRDYDLRGRLIYKATDNLTFDLRITHSKDVDGQEGIEIVTPAQFDDFSRSYMAVNSPLVSRIRLTDYSLKVDWDLGGATLTSISDLNRARSILTGDADFTPNPILYQITTRNVNAWSQELRLASNSGPADRLKWLVGGFYQDRKTLNGLVVPFDDGQGQPSSNVVINSQDHGRSKSWAVFGQATYKVTDALDLTGGARYDSDKRSSVDAAVPGSRIGETFSEFQPKATLAYHFSPNSQVYATYSRGFRSGGFNAFFSVGGFNREYKPQVNDNYEIGGKIAALGGKVFLSASLYHTKQKNQQLFFINANPPSQNIVTIDKSHVNGGELEVTARLARNFNLNANVGVADTTIDRFTPQPSAKGNHAPIAPLYTVGANVDYTIDLDDKNKLVAYLGWNRRGKTYWDTANTTATPAKDIVDARLAFEHDGWKITGFVRNLLNRQYPVQALVDAFGPGLHGRAISLPRTYGVEAGYRF